MTTEHLETIIIYLDKYIIEKIDSFKNRYINHPRGKLISSSLAFYLSQDAEIRKVYMDKARCLVQNTSELDAGDEYGLKRKGKTRVNLYLKPSLAKYMRDDNKKMVLIASLIYVGLIKI